MKTVLIHGDDTAKSFARYNQIIKVTRRRGWQIVRIEKSSKLNLQEQLSTNSLFDEEKLYILSKPKDTSDDTFKWLEEHGSEIKGNLLIYLPSLAPQTLIKKLPKNTASETFTLPKLLFTFLDSVYPDNYKSAIKLLHKVTDDEPLELVFAMLARHVRDLFWAASDSESLQYPSWRRGKLKSQSSKFPDNTLPEFINSLSDIDIKSKSSKLDLGTALDLKLAIHLK